MQTGVSMELHLTRLGQCFLCLFLLLHLCLAAPGLPGTEREVSLDTHSSSVVLANPFGSREEDHRLLQSYIQSSLKDDKGGTEINTWEQEVFFLFRLYDFDRSGFLDGLEMMKLLSDYNSHTASEAQANELVVSLVDFLLQTQDVNQDGLLAPSELLSPGLPDTQGSSSNSAPHQDQKVAVEEKQSNPETDEQGGVGKEEREQQQTQHQEEEHLEQQAKAEEDEAVEQIDEQYGQKHIDPPVEIEKLDQEAPVHQGQPEI
ncbi:cell growth regulator with EF hand domain protein 1 [Thalassophryne amazonica]|uniref:cell growth regulator with EF hand domain protein 1 n=1 Tax=Thalassophryne amazonica TaxID=390379 RepID=UPI0014709665|nr:cell growth regulator with EF hand domain protein 1 [Thalassophryne amazonica]